MPVTYYTEQEVERLLENMISHIHTKLFQLQMSESDVKIRSGIYKCMKVLNEVPTVPRKHHR